MPISANVLQPLIDFFEGILKFFHDTVGFSWGLSIIFLTFVVRAALVPLTVKQFRSMQALARLQPEIKKLQQKYGDDKQRLNQEMMRFYQENKVNPFSSCLPIAAQLPVFFSLFYMLRKDLRRHIRVTAGSSTGCAIHRIETGAATAQHPRSSRRNARAYPRAALRLRLRARRRSARGAGADDRRGRARRPRAARAPGRGIGPRRRGGRAPRGRDRDGRARR